jgi:hypothetical protein
VKSSDGDGDGDGDACDETCLHTICVMTGGGVRRMMIAFRLGCPFQVVEIDGREWCDAAAAGFGGDIGVDLDP